LGKTSPPKWASTSSIGSPPSDQTAPNSGSDVLGGNITTDQLLYYGTTDQVISGTLVISKVDMPVQQVRASISLLGPATTGQPTNTPSSGTNGVVDVKVTAPTASEALALNNAFDLSMELQVAAAVQTAHNSAITSTEQTLARVLYQGYTGKLPFGVTRAALQIQITSLENELAALVVQQPSTSFQVTQAPEATNVTKITTTSTLSKRPVRAAAGLGIGVVLGLLAALGLWLLDKRLKTAKRAQAAFAYPVVAEIPADSSDATEPYRLLWLSVFREPLPLPPAPQNRQLYEGEDPVLEAGVGSGQGGAQ
jgi:capsular polysaccharide biosynthesis protein